MATVDMPVGGVTLTRAEVIAERASDDELVAVVRSRLTGGALASFDHLGLQERSLLATLERQMVRSLPFVTNQVWRDVADGGS